MATPQLKSKLKTKSKSKTRVGFIIRRKNRHHCRHHTGAFNQVSGISH